MAKLHELLTESEGQQISELKTQGNCPPVHLNTEVKHLTVEQLSKIAFILIETEHGDKLHKCILSAEAVTILTRRAIKIGIGIFDAF